MGFGPVFWVWTSLLPDLTQKGHLELHHILPSSTINWLTHHPVCASRVLLRLREWCVIIGCLCNGSVYCASMPAIPEVCQHARGSSQKCLCFPGCFLEVPAVQDVLKAKTLCHCARWFKFTRLYLWLRFICNDDFCVFYSLMWWPIGLCLSPFIVSLSLFIVLDLGFIMEDTVYSLCLAFLKVYIHESYSTW